MLEQEILQTKRKRKVEKDTKRRATSWKKFASEEKVSKIIKKTCNFTLIFITFKEDETEYDQNVFVKTEIECNLTEVGTNQEEAAERLASTSWNELAAKEEEEVSAIKHIIF